MEKLWDWYVARIANKIIEDMEQTRISAEIIDIITNIAMSKALVFIIVTLSTIIIIRLLVFAWRWVYDWFLSQ